MADSKTGPKPAQKAVGYIRTSTDKQEDSPEAQRIALAAWAKLNEIEVVSFHTATITSGAPLYQRIALLTAIGDLRPGYLIVSVQRDRFSRDVVKMAMIERLVERAGASLTTADGSSGSGTPEGQFMRSVMDAVAQLERAHISARTRRVMQAKKAKGEKISGNPPFGWKHVGNMTVKHPAEQATVALIVEWRAAGNSLAVICKLLTARKKKPRGTRWHPTTVQRILKANS